MNREDFYTQEEALAALGVGRTQLYALIKRHPLKSRMVRGRRWFTRESVLAVKAARDGVDQEGLGDSPYGKSPSRSWWKDGDLICAKMLSGAITKPTPQQIVAIYGRAALQEALARDANFGTVEIMHEQIEKVRLESPT